jgi:hypothetical protein
MSAEQKITTTSLIKSAAKRADLAGKLPDRKMARPERFELPTLRFEA